MKRKTFTGVTLIELMVVVAVLCVVMAAAAPSIIGMINRRRVELAMSQLATDLAYARSEATAQNASVIGVMFIVSPGSQCYTLAYGGRFGQCDCSYGVGNACSKTFGTGTELRTTQIPPNWNLVVTGAGWHYAALTAVITPVNNAVTISDQSGDAQLKISPLSSLSPARICSPNGTISGYAAC